MNKNNLTKVMVALISFLVVLVVVIVAIKMIPGPSQKSLPEPSETKSQIKAFIFPESLIIEEGATEQVQVFFNTGQTPISAITLRLVYPYTNPKPEITTDKIEINPELLTSENWSCPIKTITPVEGLVEIDIACLLNNQDVFQSPQDTLLATISLTALELPNDDPINVSFDQNQSTVSFPVGNSSIPIGNLNGLTLIPSRDNQETKENTQESVLGLATESDLSLPDKQPGEVLSSLFDSTSTPSATPTATLTLTPTPTRAATVSAELPETGITWPGLAIAVGGIVFLLMAGVLAL